MSTLKPARELLDAAERIEALRDQLGAIEKASRDRVMVGNHQQKNEHQARRLLRELGRPTDLEQAEPLRLRADEPAIVRALGRNFVELRGQAEMARRTIAHHEEQIKSREVELRELEQPVDIDVLRRAVRQARKAGDLESRLSQAHEKSSQAHREAAAALGKITGWHRTGNELRHLAVPLGASLDQFESRFLELSQRRHALSEQLAKEKELIGDRESNLHALSLHQDVPSEEDVLVARRRRERGWRLVQAAWLEGARGGEDLAAFLAEFATTSGLPEAYAESVKHADALADRLRREADRVARKAELQVALERHRASGAELKRELDAIENREIALKKRWDELVGPLGVDAEKWTPFELRAWLRQREEIVKLVEKVEELYEAIEPLELALASHADALQKAFGRLSSEPMAEKLDLADLLERAEDFIKRQDALVQKRAQLESTLEAARTEQADAGLAACGRDCA